MGIPSRRSHSHQARRHRRKTQASETSKRKQRHPVKQNPGIPSTHEGIPFFSKITLHISKKKFPRPQPPAGNHRTGVRMVNHRGVVFVHVFGRALRMFFRGEGLGVVGTCVRVCVRMTWTYWTYGTCGTYRDVTRICNQNDLSELYSNTTKGWEDTTKQCAPSTRSLGAGHTAS